MSSTMSMPSVSGAESTIPTPNQRLFDLLPEIWLLVLPYLKSYDLQSISLTCSTFRYMAQPLLFSVLDVSPFLLSYNAEQPILRPRKYLNRFLTRLEYYKLPHISHGVHHCWMSPYSRFGFPTRNQQDDLDPNLIITAAVEALPNFPNLSTLSWHCIDIAPEWWDVLQSLRITKLWLNSSSVPSCAISPLRSITHLDLDQWPWEGRVTNHVSIHEERTNGVRLAALQSVIQPNIIRSISVPRADTACHLFSVLSGKTYELRSLNIPFASVADPHFIDALEHCPRLESLCILPPSSDERYRDVKLDTFANSALPSLTLYEGPYTHVLQFSRQPLKHVSLWGFDDRPSFCDPDALVEILTELAETSTVNSLESLALTMIGITSELLESFAAFRRLEQIIIQSQDSSARSLPMPHPLRPSAPVTSLYAMMGKVSLPQTLKYLKLSTRLSSPRLDLAAQEHEVACFTESIARRHPCIQRIEIAYGIYWTGMYSAVWGRIRKNGDTQGAASASAADSASTLGHEAGDDAEASIDADPPRIAKEDMEGGYSSKSSSKDYILSTVVSTVHPLPLGKLTFTEHRRTILFQHDTAAGGGFGFGPEDEGGGEAGGRRFWNLAWIRLRRLFGKEGS